MDKTIFDEMIATRRHLHRFPEEGWTEFQTTYLIATRLRELGYTDVRLGRQIIDTEAVLGRNPEQVKASIDRAIKNGVPETFIQEIDELTGCVAILNTGRTGPVTALRFDIE